MSEKSPAELLPPTAKRTVKTCPARGTGFIWISSQPRQTCNGIPCRRKAVQRRESVEGR